jgi:hypothetical protein
MFIAFSSVFLGCSLTNAVPIKTFGCVICLLLLSFFVDRNGQKYKLDYLNLKNNLSYHIFFRKYLDTLSNESFLFFSHTMNQCFSIPTLEKTGERMMTACVELQDGYHISIHWKVKRKR